MSNINDPWYTESSDPGSEPSMSVFDDTAPGSLGDLYTEDDGYFEDEYYPIRFKKTRAVFFVIFSILAFTGLIFTISSYTPLGIGSWNPLLFSLGVGITLILCFLSFRLRLRADDGLMTFFSRALYATLAIFFVFFAVGMVSKPVVVEGQVVLVFSGKYKQTVYANEMYNNLVTLKDYSALLSYKDAEAWSRSKDYTKALENATSMGLYYRSVVDENKLPDPAFGPATVSAANSAFAMSRALEKKIILLKTPDSEIEKQMQEANSVFASEWIKTGQELGKAARDLNIPIQMQEGK